MTLTSLTNELINNIEHIKEQFYTEEQIEDEQLFFQHVKKETDPIFQRLNEWENAVLSYIQSHKSIVHLKQVIATKENIELLIIHGYFKDMRKRRFMEYYQSSLFVLNNLKEELKHDE